MPLSKEKMREYMRIRRGSKLAKSGPCNDMPEPEKSVVASNGEGKKPASTPETGNMQDKAASKPCFRPISKVRYTA